MNTHAFSVILALLLVLAVHGQPSLVHTVAPAIETQEASSTGSATNASLDSSEEHMEGPISAGDPPLPTRSTNASSSSMDVEGRTAEYAGIVTTRKTNLFTRPSSLSSDRSSDTTPTKPARAASTTTTTSDSSAPAIYAFTSFSSASSTASTSSGKSAYPAGTVAPFEERASVPQVTSAALSLASTDEQDIAVSSAVSSSPSAAESPPSNVHTASPGASPDNDGNDDVPSASSRSSAFQSPVIYAAVAAVLATLAVAIVTARTRARRAQQNTLAVCAETPPSTVWAAPPSQVRVIAIDSKHVAIL